MTRDQSTKTTADASTPKPSKGQDAPPAVASREIKPEGDGAKKDAAGADRQPSSPEQGRETTKQELEREVQPEPKEAEPLAQTASESLVEDAAPVAVTMEDSVMERIVALAAQSVAGVHSLGKPRWLPLSGDARRGVEVEIGLLEAAIDLDVVVEYGVDIRAMTLDLRSKISEHVAKMASRKVVEVNIHVVGIQLPEQEKNKNTSRVK